MRQALLLLPALLFADRLLLPMDEAQSDHLKAYGVAYHALERGFDVEWLLNLRGGSFLMEYVAEVEAYAAAEGVTTEVVSEAKSIALHKEIEVSNMDAVLLEKAPKVAVYISPYEEPWDDAVSLALEYARIPYERVWDEEVLRGGVLKEIDWLHLHHEDFTGQYGKFYGSYGAAPWYRNQVAVNERVAKELGFRKVSRCKLAVAKAIREYIASGGFLFAMCSAPITLDIALAAEGTDIAASVYDGDPVDAGAQSALDFSRTIAFEDFRILPDPLVYEHSTVDVTQAAVMRGPNTWFSLFEFSARFDPVPTMLTQCHTSVVKEYLGQDSGFDRKYLKEAMIVMGEVKGTEEVKYIYRTYGEGFVSYLAGHDPEDYQHFIGDPPTDLRLHRNSPGYRLILNNVLFPAAKKKKLKT